jgi:hypothetical protein
LRPTFFIAILTLALTLILQAGAGLPLETEAIVWPIVAGVLVAAACVETGGAAGLLLRSLALTLSERFLIGALLLGLWIFVVGHLGFLVPAAVVAPLIVMPLIGIIRLLRRGFATAEILDTPIAFKSRIELAGWFVTGTAVLWAAAGALAPPTGMDALVYHLGLPIQYLLRESLLPPDSVAYYFYWQQFELLATAVLALDPSGVAVNLMNVGFLLAFLDGVRKLAQPDSAGAAGIIAAASWATSGMLLILLLHSKNDLMLLALITAGAFRARDEGASSAILAGLFLGGAVAIKPSAGYAAGPILLCVLWERGTRQAFFAGAAGAFLPALWALRNMLLSREILPGNVTISAGAAEITRGFQQLLETLHHLLFTFFEISGAGLQGPIGPALLALVAAAIASHGAALRTRRMLVCQGLGFALWLLTGGGNVRYLLPVLVIVTAAGAAVAADSRSRILAASLALAWFVSLGTQVQYGEGKNRFLMLHTGRLTRAHHIREWLNSYFVLADANRLLPPSAAVISVGEARLFHLRRRAVFDGYWEKSRVLAAAERLDDPVRLREELKASGYTHLLYNLPTLQDAVERELAAAPSPESLRILERMLAECPRTSFDPETGIGLYAL